jgi:hypothetical protein
MVWSFLLESFWDLLWIWPGLEVEAVALCIEEDVRAELNRVESDEPVHKPAG